MAMVQDSFLANHVTNLAGFRFCAIVEYQQESFVILTQQKNGYPNSSNSLYSLPNTLIKLKHLGKPIVVSGALAHFDNQDDILKPT